MKYILSVGDGSKSWALFEADEDRERALDVTYREGLVATNALLEGFIVEKESEADDVVTECGGIKELASVKRAIKEARDAGESVPYFVIPVGYDDEEEDEEDQ